MTQKILTTYFLVIAYILQAYSSSPFSQQAQQNSFKKGGQFKDLFLPIPIINGLESNVWGADNVIPRDADNGLEDETYSYWGGNIIMGDDGKYHGFICRWREDNVRGDKSGHHTWWSSDVVHAVSDNPLGPYKVIAEVGPGHNPEIYRLKDGSYIIGILGSAYKGPTLNGPWTKIETTLNHNMEWIMNENKTYVVREDGSILMMNKNGVIFLSETNDENFTQVSPGFTFHWYNGANMEDPVMWKDEVQYHCVYNDSFGRIAFYMRSKDGINWTWEDGVAYDTTIINHEDGTNEGWYKIERPKVIQDQFGRATHMNFAVIDCPKDDDLANDNHSSKNVVVPLVLSRRMQILNEESIIGSSADIRVKIFADAGFNPHTDIDLSTLRFGASKSVNYGNGCEAKSIEASGNDAIITFVGGASGLTNDNFAAKLLGETKNGDLVFGFASLKQKTEPAVTSIIIEAEDFKSTGGTVSDSKVGEGVFRESDAISWVNEGDWIQYDINVAESGMYTITYNISSNIDGGQIQFLLEDSIISTDDVNNNSSWYSWYPLEASNKVSLTKGVHTVRIKGVGANNDFQWNLDKITFSKVSDTPTGISKTQIAGITIYPNPASTHVYVSGVESGSYKLLVYNLTGNLLVNENVNSEDAIDISSLKKGIYLLELDNAGLIYKAKLIVD